MSTQALSTTSDWARVLGLALALLAGCSRGPGAAAEAEGFYLQGTQRYLQGDFPAALESFAAVERLTPLDPRLPAARGEVFLSMGALNEALAAFEQASRLQPDRATHWSRLGFIHAQLGQSKDSRAALARALKLSPNDARALEQLGRLELAAGRTEAAFDLLSRASRFAPAREQPGLSLLAASIVIRQERHAEVVAFLEDARARGVQSAELLSALGDAQVELGAFLPAVDAYTAAARLAPKDPSLWELVGVLYLKLGESERAIRALRKSISIEDRTSPQVVLAQIYWSRDETRPAKEALDRALDAAPRAEPGDLVELARLLALFGRQADALRLLQHVSAEPEPSRDARLQLQAAGLAGELGARDVARAACARAKAADAGVRCPPSARPR